MNDAQLALLAGTLLSLAFSYIPGLKERFEKQTSETKRLIMAGSLLVVSLFTFGSACVNLGLPFDITCDQAGAVGLATTFLLSLVSNQATYQITKG